MKVSIITVCFNSVSTIENSIVSVTGQKYNDIEYIVVDGGSTDGTLDILKAYSNKIHKIISEPDNGIYDAMNKGLEMATGYIVGMLNSDDFYYDENTISTVANVFNDKQVDCCYGDLEYVDPRNTNMITRKWTSKPNSPDIFRTGFHPPHSTFFARKDLYVKYGNFDPSLTISADYELMLRFIEKHKANAIYIPGVMVRMRNGGVSNKNIFQIIKANAQCYKAWKKNKLRVSPITIIKKPLSKISQLTHEKI